MTSVRAVIVNVREDSDAQILWKNLLPRDQRERRMRRRREAREPSMATVEKVIEQQSDCSQTRTASIHVRILRGQPPQGRRGPHSSACFDREFYVHQDLKGREAGSVAENAPEKTPPERCTTCGTSGLCIVTGVEGDI